MPPELYRHHLQMPIRYGDMDTLGHVGSLGSRVVSEKCNVFR